VAQNKTREQIVSSTNLSAVEFLRIGSRVSTFKAGGSRHEKATPKKMGWLEKNYFYGKRMMNPLSTTDTGET
jgi:hypothetical protein